MNLTLKNPDKNFNLERIERACNYALQRSKSGIFIMEIWKDVKDYEGFYQVSNLGRVRSIDRYVNYSRPGFKAFKKGKVLSLGSTNGYLLCNLGKNDTGTNKLAHRLVAEVFIDNPENKPCVNHKDFNPSNNMVGNLEWVTYKENIQHAIKNNMITRNSGEKNHMSKVSNLDRNKIVKLSERGLSQSEIGILYNLHQTTIWNILKYKKWMN